MIVLMIGTIICVVLAFIGIAVQEGVYRLEYEIGFHEGKKKASKRCNSAASQ